MKKHFSALAFLLFLSASVFQSCTEVKGPCLDDLPEPSASINGKGYITIFATGGAPPYQYALDTIPFREVDSNFFWTTNYPDAKYNIGVKDANGCIKWVIQELDKTPSCTEPDSTDIRDGKKYCTVLINNKRWFQQNLNFNDNNSYCFKNNQVNCDYYGKLYTYREALTVCPTGWHLPSLAEWLELISHAGGLRNKVAFGKLAAGGSLGFESLATERRNFPASPEFRDVTLPGDDGYYWTKDSSATTLNYAYAIKFAHGNIQIIDTLVANMEFAHSCRCLHD